MRTEDMQIKLIKSTIHTISEVGIDRATTKLLATNAGLNEVYIYRIFGGKEELFKETFTYIDKEFSAMLLQLIPTMYNSHADIKQRFKNYFYALWQYVLEDKEKYTFFIRYYYSRCFVTQTICQKIEKPYMPALWKSLIWCSPTTQTPSGFLTTY